MLFILILIINLALFILGNLVYSPSFPIFLPNLKILSIDIPVFKILISEASFILIYTMVDKGNTKYNWVFPFCSALIVLQFALPNYKFLFYSQSVQYFSITISVLSLIINTIIIKKLINSGYSKLLSSRVSTTLASVVEISLFAFLLNIGVQGAIGTIIARVFYVTVIPKFFFTKNK